MYGEMQDANILNSQSTWQELYPLIREDDRYHKMLGQEGSTPLDLFKHKIEMLRDAVYEDKKLVKKIFAEGDFTFSTDVAFESFSAAVQADPRGANITENNRKQIYSKMLEKLKSRLIDGDKSRVGANNKRERGVVEVDEGLDGMSKRAKIKTKGR